MGSGEDGEGLDEMYVPTVGSRSASLHRSTSGKREAGGSAVASTDVACVHDVRISGVAEGSCFCGDAGVNRALRYGTTVFDRICFA